MPDEGEQMHEEFHVEHQSNVGKWILTVVAVLVVAVFGYAHYLTHDQLGKISDQLAASQAQVKELQARIQNAEAQEETLAQQAGMTKKELAQRTAQLQAQQKAAESRLEQEQKAQISQVSGDIAGVKTDVGGVKTDVASTKADLEATKAKLQSTVGDLGVQSGLIANTRDDLEALKHKGDRNYYEFTLVKGAKPQPISTVSLQLKKTDAKKGKFSLNVTADDKTIEKRDRNVAEPIQFYSGRDHLLFELVVWTVDKNKATGYLSTPKNAPVPVTASAPSGNGGN
jgi:multidrug efflux pump subunit AcrA (membrane-fusion protein)